jgi:BirA family transcriptional regulator, biotin operon repressor / biotin---[acetyl-CoA-carboxylase] ligase
MAGADLRAAPLLHVVSTGSTNEDLLARARAGEAGPLWLRADRQLQGRGRLGRAWSSPPGNLHLSLLLPEPAVEPRFLPQLAHVAAVALAAAAAAVTGQPGQFRLKWPNDLLHGSAKVAGILLEGTPTPRGGTACVVGWGINCIHHPEGLPYPTTDFSTACGRPITADAVSDALRGSMNEALTAWDGGRNYAAIRTAWLRDGLPLGTDVTVKTLTGVQSGRYSGLDEVGRFLLRTAAGLVPVEAGDINLQSETAAPVG